MDISANPPSPNLGGHRPKISFLFIFCLGVDPPSLSANMAAKRWSIWTPGIIECNGFIFSDYTPDIPYIGLSGLLQLPSMVLYSLSPPTEKFQLDSNHLLGSRYS